MGDLSRNFSRLEFRCPCCGNDGVSVDLVMALQELRDKAGVPIAVTSGVRCDAWNEKVGGSKRSQHILGKAADIVIRGAEPAEAMELAVLVDAFRDGGIGVYPDNGFIHVDVRGRKARWVG